MAELAGFAEGGQCRSMFSDFDITNAAELEAHVNVNAAAAKRNFDAYYAARLEDVSKLWTDQRRRLDVRCPFEVPVVPLNVGTPKFDFTSLPALFRDEAERRAEVKEERAQRVAQGDTTTDLEVDKRVDQTEPLQLKLTGVDYTNIDKVVAALKDNAEVQRLDLSNNGLDKDDCGALATFCATNSTVRSLDLSGNPLGSEGIEQLVGGLKENKTLTNVDLGGAEISKSGAVALAAWLPGSSLQRLQLGGNKLGIYGAEALGAGLRAAPALTAVGLQNNNLGDDGVDKLFQTVFAEGETPPNSTITQLALDANRASDEMTKRVDVAVAANEAMQQLRHLEDVEEAERSARWQDYVADLGQLRELQVKLATAIADAAAAKKQEEDEAKAKAAPPKATAAGKAPAKSPTKSPAKAPVAAARKTAAKSPTKSPAKAPVKAPPAAAPKARAKSPPRVVGRPGAKAPASAASVAAARGKSKSPSRPPKR